MLNKHVSTKVDEKKEAVISLNRPSDTDLLQIIVFRLVNVT